MKRILAFTVLVLITVVSQAQKKKSTSKNSSYKNHVAQVEKNTKTKLDTLSFYAVMEDSLRFSADSVELAQFDSVRMAWRDSVTATMNAENEVAVNAMILGKEKRDAQERETYLLYKKADFSNNQIAQLRISDAEYFDKIDKINADSNLSDADRSNQLAAASTAQEEKIKLFVGKSKYKKLEKARESKK